jgi:putative hydrolase of the HAD superfamily
LVLNRVDSGRKEAAIGDIQVIFSDVGGVLGTNGWDHLERQAAMDEFGLDPEEFESRHEMVVTAFETGQLSLDCYLDRTVFYRQRPFTRDTFRDFMLQQSQPYLESVGVLRRVSATGRYLLATLNNESLELNEHRIQAFGLRQIFKLFLSSCFLGVLKPDQAFYQLALKLTQQQAIRCVFIDDRALNVECARREGMQTIQFKHAAQLEADLRALGVQID